MGTEEEMDLPPERMHTSTEMSIEMDDCDNSNDPSVSSMLQTNPGACDEMEETGLAGIDPQNIYSETNAFISDTLEESGRNHTSVPILKLPQLSKKPVYEFDHENLFANTYPWLFPGRVGDISGGSTNQSTLTEWQKILVHYDDSRFSRDPMFLFHFQNVQQRSLSKQNSSYFVNQYISDPAITLKDI